jgi:hypothetical protein
VTRVNTLTIPARFNGPAGSGNGGFSAGELAGFLPAESTVEVTLRVPPPLDTELRVQVDSKHARAYDGDVLVAEAVLVDNDLLPVPTVGFDQAADAATRFDGFRDHPFTTCFVCGTERPGQDGLALYAGAIRPGPPTRVGTPFVPRADVDLDPTLVWAALDCPGGWSIGLAGRRAVLGRMAARVFAVPTVGERCVVTAECDSWQGRKAFSRSTAYGEDGRTLGVARATWIELR